MDGSLAGRLGEESQTATRNAIRPVTPWLMWGLPPPAALQAEGQDASWAGEGGWGFGGQAGRQG